MDCNDLVIGETYPLISGGTAKFEFKYNDNTFTFIVQNTGFVYSTRYNYELDGCWSGEGPEYKLSLDWEAIRLLPKPSNYLRQIQMGGL
jgi:hypothetical protein